MGKTQIEWTRGDDGTPGMTWNPTTGCSVVSPGCTHCYAAALSLRRGWTKKPWTAANAAENVVLHPDRLDAPLRWKKPRRVFVNSMSDLFHERVPDQFIFEVWLTMSMAHEHTFQILTKRPERMAAYLLRMQDMGATGLFSADFPPLPNVWLGVSCEDQRRADERIPLLLQTPAAVRFLSCEPLLGPIDLAPYFHARPTNDINDHAAVRPIRWVIVGGESAGPPERRLVEHIDGELHPRPTYKGLDWVRSLRDQCIAAGVAFFFKQWGGPTPKAGGRLLDGVEWNEYPQEVAP